MKKITLALFVLLFAGMISAEKIAEFPDLMKPRFIKTDGDDFLVCEGHTFRNFSLKSRKLKYQFGSKGDGPGEFQFPPRQVVIYPEVSPPVTIRSLKTTILLFSDSLKLPDPVFDPVFLLFAQKK